MTFFEKLKTEAEPHLTKFKAASALAQIGVVVGALVAFYVIVTMLPALLFLGVVAAIGWAVYTAAKSDKP